jgi:hypothetical protein
MCTFHFEIMLDNALAGIPNRLDWDEGEREPRRLRIIAKAAIEAHQFARKLRDELLTEWISDDLTGACAIASAFLHARLKEQGINSRVCLGDCHAFVRVDDLYVDVTCEQFGYEPIWIGPNPPNENPTWYEDFSTDDIHDLMTQMEHGAWPWDARQIHDLVVRRAA